MVLERILSEQRVDIEQLDVGVLCPRKEELEVNLNSNLAQIVIGVRRSGKSTLCQKVLLQSGVNFAYINFDDERLSDFSAKNFDEMLEMQYRLFGKFTHIFMDEVQNVDKWHLFVNRLLRQGLKVILTGSNANLLSNELSTHLTGRYHQIELFPFSFKEYCLANNVDIKHKTTKAIGLRKNALDKYLYSGGFPELLNLDTPKDYVKSLLSAIVFKDVSQRYGIRYKQTLYDLANNLLDNFCQEQSVANMAKTLGIKSDHTMKNYVSYMENAYLVRSVPKYSFKSQTKILTRKYYAIDMAFVSKRDTLQTENFGWRLENVVAIELMRRINSEYEQVFYLKKNKDFEVDFVVVSNSKIIELVQVTYNFREPSVKLRNRELFGLVKAAKQTKCKKLTLVMMEGEAGTELVEGFEVNKVLAVDWLLNENFPKSAKKSQNFFPNLQ